MSDVNLFTGIIFPYANLALFLFLANKFLKPPLLAMIAGRKTQYLELLKDANQAKDEALAKHKELQTKLNALNSEIELIKSKANEQAEKEAAKIIADAEALAKHLKIEARKIAETEVELARKQLQDEILEGVQNKVIEHLQQNLDADKQKTIFMSQLNSLNAMRGNA